MKIDFHTHTRRYSSCSSLTVDELLEAERAAGIEGVVLTDHEQFWPPEEFEGLRRRTEDLVLFNGAEFSVGSLHHVLTILPEPPGSLRDLREPVRFIDRVQRRGGYVIAAHPFRFYPDYDERNQRYSLDGVEVASRGMTRPEEERQARELAEEWDADCFATSDAHSPSPIGSFYTHVEGTPETNGELIEVLRNATPEPVIRRETYDRNRLS